MGSGITYNSRVSHLIFLLFIKKLRGLESKNTGGTLSCAFSSQRPVNIYRPKEGSIIYFFWGGRGGVAWFLEGMGWIWVVVNRV